MISGNYDATDDSVALNVAKDVLVTVMDDGNTTDINNFENSNLEYYGPILPVMSMATSFPTQKGIADEFTLNREQRAAFMIITSHLDGDSRCRGGILANNACHKSE